MIEFVWDDSFIKNVKKWLRKHPELKIKFEECIRLFTQDPFHPSPKTHNLSGKLSKYFTFSISHQYRIVFKFLSASKVLLIEISTHEEVY